MIKNKYEIRDGTVYMNVAYKDENYICEFDESDFDLVSSYNAKWCAKKMDGKIRYVYCSKKINGKSKTYSLHRVLLNFPDGLFVDHINRNPLNNKRSNLRLADILTNSQNRTKNRTSNHKQPTSKYKGINARKRKNSTSYTVYIKGKAVATFKDEIIASNYYNHLAIKEFGEFACLNEVPFISLEDCENAKFKGTSDINGIHYSSKEKKWVAQIYDKSKKKQFRLGRYKTEEDAILALNRYKEENELCC